MSIIVFKKRLLFTCLGIILICIGLSLCLQGNVGLDPFGAMCKGLGNILGLTLGHMQLIVGLGITCIVYFVDRPLIGIGTLINMTCCGYLIDFFSHMHSICFSFPQNFLFSSLHLLLGLLVFTIGISLYICSSLGIGPYDAISLIIVRKFSLPFKYCRIAQDSTCMLAAILLGAPVGIATIIMAFFIGPLVSFWNRQISAKIFGHSIEQ